MGHSCLAFTLTAVSIFSLQTIGPATGGQQRSGGALDRSRIRSQANLLIPFREKTCHVSIRLL